MMPARFRHRCSAGDTVIAVVLALAAGTPACTEGDQGGDGGVGDTAGDRGPGSGGFDCPAPCNCFGAVSAGETLTCALKTSGSVWCWGQGPVGDGTADSRLLPVAVTGLAGVTAIAVGRWHACALKADGTVWCWGRNANGQVDDSKTDRLGPVAVSAAGMATAVAVTGRFSCALAGGGGVVCWGERPISPGAQAAAVSLSVGDAHSCFVRADGGLWCLGNNGNGEFGSGAMGGSSPVPVASMFMNAGAVDVGAFHTVALGRDGTAWWWGYDAVLGKTAIPLRAGAIAGAVGISAGQQHSCAVTGQGAVWCWGLGDNGRLGHGRTDNAQTPVMADVTGAGQVSTGQRHTCAVLKDGPIHCWGHNDVGQLGNGTRDGSLRPAPVPLGCP